MTAQSQPFHRSLSHRTVGAAAAAAAVRYSLLVQSTGNPYNYTRTHSSNIEVVEVVVVVVGGIQSGHVLHPPHQVCSAVVRL